MSTCEARNCGCAGVRREPTGVSLCDFHDEKTRRPAGLPDAASDEPRKGNGAKWESSRCPICGELYCIERTHPMLADVLAEVARLNATLCRPSEGALLAAMRAYGDSDSAESGPVEDLLNIAALAIREAMRLSKEKEAECKHGSFHPDCDECLRVQAEMRLSKEQR